MDCPRELSPLTADAGTMNYLAFVRNSEQNIESCTTNHRTYSDHHTMGHHIISTQTTKTSLTTLDIIGGQTYQVQLHLNLS